MDKAFDIVFQTEVDAGEIAKTLYYSVGDRFRYKCLCCGEDVYLAAADSIVMTPHFRHRRGNNETDCERYLGQPGAIEHYVLIRKNNREHVRFCFNIEQKIFEMSINLSHDEIESFVECGKKISLFTKNSTQAFFTIQIHKGILLPDKDNYFMLDEYSNDYYVSVDNSGMKEKYSDVIKSQFRLNIYRINAESVHYKRNTSGILYTGDKYLAVSESENYIAELINLDSVNEEDGNFSFITLGRKFHAAKFSIHFIDHNTQDFFRNHGLSIECAESMDILWPPVFTKDNVIVSNEEKMYLLPSFEFIPHGNIDSNGMSLRKICNNIYEICYKDRVAIIEKNVECQVLYEEYRLPDTTYDTPEYIYSNKFIVSDSYSYFLFDKNGCTPLAVGATIYLSDTDYIVGYKNGHVKVMIVAEERIELDKGSLIQVVIKYHPQNELFEPDDFMDIVAEESVLSYLESCYRSGRINSVIKQYIKEGLI